MAHSFEVTVGSAQLLLKDQDVTTKTVRWASFRCVYLCVCVCVCKCVCIHDCMVCSVYTA